MRPKRRFIFTSEPEKLPDYYDDLIMSTYYLEEKPKGYAARKMQVLRRGKPQLPKLLPKAQVRPHPA